MASIGAKEHREAGTNDPHWAIKTIRAFCLRKVLLPPIFGPVRRRNFPSTQFKD
jgi:hypothetical protein